MKPDFQTLLQEHSRLSLAYAEAVLGLEEQILYLVQADLRHRRLLHNLQEAGLDAGDFHWELHNAFLGLLGLVATLEDEDMWLDRYVALLQIYLRLPLDLYLELLPEIAREIVDELRKANRRLRKA